QSHVRSGYTDRFRRIGMMFYPTNTTAALNLDTLRLVHGSGSPLPLPGAGVASETRPAPLRRPLMGATASASTACAPLRKSAQSGLRQAPFFCLQLHGNQEGMGQQRQG